MARGNIKRCQNAYRERNNGKIIIVCSHGGTRCPLDYISRIFCEKRKTPKPIKTIAVCNAEKWIESLRKKGITRFKLKELPDELKVEKHILRTARTNYLIKRVEKDEWKVSTWLIQ